MGHGGDARDAAADLGVGERLLDRGEEIVHRRVGALDERRRDALRPGLDHDGRRLQIHPARVRLAHPRIDLDHGGAMPVQRDLDLLAA
jgi:hypothetical protein